MQIMSMKGFVCKSRMQSDLENDGCMISEYDYSGGMDLDPEYIHDGTLTYPSKLKRLA